MAEQDRNGLWLATASSAERAEVRGTAVDRVTKFLECFPPLRRSWWPVLESPLRAELGGGRIVLSGRVDLVLGRTVGLVAGKAFVDFKTGSRFPGHVDDLRFYALLETLRLGVPPFRLASYYLDQGDIVSEDVTEAVLEAAAARAADGVVKLVELRLAEREPTRRAGPSCRRCPLVDGLRRGQARPRCDGRRRGRPPEGGAVRRPAPTAPPGDRRSEVEADVEVGRAVGQPADRQQVDAAPGDGAARPRA